MSFHPENFQEHYKSVRARLWPTKAAVVHVNERKPETPNATCAQPAQLRPSLTPPVARDILSIATPRDDAMEFVREVAEKHGASLAEVMSHRRSHRIVMARHACYIEVRKAFPSWTYTKIGRFFGKDHSTVFHCIKKYGEH